ncbi:MAG: MobF family relaxase [Nocardioidaceae bacterium]
MDGETYERWVAGYDVDTGKAKGRLRDDGKALRFVEVTVNGPKTWSLAAALHPEVSEALDAAQDRAAEQIIGWLAEHATTRVGPRGRQVQVPVEQIEAAVIRHYTSRAGDPHRHLHLQVNARVSAEGKWRGLHSVGVRDMVAAINGIGHAAVATDPEFRAVLAAQGFTMDPATAEVVELAPYVGQFSARTAQIGRNLGRYEADWRADHPGEEPGPRLRQGWDRRAWAEARPQKQNSTSGPQHAVVPDGAEMVAVWNAVLHQLGYRDPAQPGLPIPPMGPAVGSLDRDGAADLVVSRLGAARSAWNAADLRGGVEEWIAATGLVAEVSVRIELAEDITARAVALSVPLLDQQGGPEHVRSLTSLRVLAVEADLVAAMVQRAAGRLEPAQSVSLLAGLDQAQRDAVAVLAGIGRLVVVEGAAGAGKTTTLAATRDLLERQGHRLVVVTPTLKAAHVAAKTAAEARSVAALVHEYGWRWDDDGRGTHEPTQPPATTLGKGDLLLVDEAGMLDQDTAHALFQVADRTGARIALVGDRHQLPAVGRGGVLDLAARWAAPEAVVELDVVHRFAEPDYAAISLAMRRGTRLGEPSGEHVGEASGEVFDALLARGHIHVHASEVERLHAVAAEVASAPGAGSGLLVIADSRAQVAALNGIIRDQRVASGVVDDTRVVFTEAGERIGVGDRVATRLNDHDLGVANRDSWTVAAVGEDGSLTLTPAGRERFAAARSVPASYARTQVELAYATTVYGAQGETTSTGHMLIAETTSASAAYVGMTRGRDNNIAHIVAEDVDQARVIWDQVMGHDRADLGPAHAAKQAAEEMERYAPQRPIDVVLDRLRAAWTVRADLTTRWERLDQQRQQTEAVRAIREESAPRQTQLRHRLDGAIRRLNRIQSTVRDLDAAMTAETENTIADLRRGWNADQPAVADALTTIHDGAGPLGLHRRQVRDAHDVLNRWAEKWRPLLPELSGDPEQVRRQIGYGERDRLQATITQVAQHATARAHPEAPLLRARLRSAGRVVDDAKAALRADQDDLAARLRPYAPVAYHPDLPELLDQVQADLDRLAPQVRVADQRVHTLTRAPEIRVLPAGRLDAEHDQWAADREAAQEAARVAARLRAAREHDAAARRRLQAPDPIPTYGPGADRQGPGIGF